MQNYGEFGNVMSDNIGHAAPFHWEVTHLYTNCCCCLTIALQNYGLQVLALGPKIAALPESPYFTVRVAEIIGPGDDEEADIIDKMNSAVSVSRRSAMLTARLLLCTAICVMAMVDLNFTHYFMIQPLMFES